MSNPRGPVFKGAYTGDEYKMAMWCNEVWIFRKHPDGQWVSFRKVDEQILIAIEDGMPPLFTVPIDEDRS